jgi:hypothetical protein
MLATRLHHPNGSYDATRVLVRATLALGQLDSSSVAKQQPLRALLCPVHRISKLRAMPNCSAYDKLGRVRTKNAGVARELAVTHCYDGNTSASGCSLAPGGANLKGELAMVSNSEATVRYSAYDPIGRVTAHQVSVAGQPPVAAAGDQGHGSWRRPTSPLRRRGWISSCQTRDPAHPGSRWRGSPLPAPG